MSSEIFDYFEGLADLDARRVRFIGDPLQRIAEDHLRILRFFRFHARFGRGEPDPQALQACTARANDLMALSRERIADELLKILALSDPTRTVSLMVERSIFRPVIPEIDEAGVQRLRSLVERSGSQAWRRSLCAGSRRFAPQARSGRNDGSPPPAFQKGSEASRLGGFEGERGFR